MFIFNFVSLITMCLRVFLLGFILSGTLCASWTFLIISFPTLRKFSCHFFKYFSRHFYLSLSPPSGTPRIWMFMHLMLSQRSLRLSSFLFIIFSIFCSMAMISTILSSRSFIHFSASVILLLIPILVYYSSLFVCSLVFVGLW